MKMQSIRKQVLLMVSILMLSVLPSFGEVIARAEFIDKPLRDILIALGQMAGKTIIVDDSVTGNATHFFKDKSFDQILALLITSHNLYEKIDDNVITISCMDVRAMADKFSVDAENVNLDYFVRRLSRDTKVTILFDQLPSQYITMHLSGVSVRQILDTLAKNISGFSLEVGDIYFYLRNSAMAIRTDNRAMDSSGSQLIQKTNGTYSIKANNAKLSDLLESLFQQDNKEYSYMRRGDQVIEKLNYSGKTFEELLRLLLQSADSDYSIKDNVYYILEVNHSDILKKFNTLARVYLKYLSINQLMNLMPSNLVNGVAIKTDKGTNSLLLSGSSEEINPLIDFIKQVDIFSATLEYYRFDLKSMTPETMAAYLPENLKMNDPIILKAQNALVLLINKENIASAQKLINTLDVSTPLRVISLKYIKAEEFIAKLPAFISRDQVSVGPDSRYIFFLGTDSSYQQVLSNLRYIDQPTPQIRYQILVIQFQEDGAESLNLNFKPAYVGTDSDTSNGFSATFDKLLALNFNVVSSFGLNFASGLNASLKKESANILVDTTLNGLTGQDVTFKNTNTVRTKDKETTTSNGTTTTTEVIRELVTGIQLAIKGYTSGDGYITMTMTASISRAGGASSDSSLPPTYEKSVTTSVRTQSGTPTIISGLLQHEVDNTENRTPILSDIPLLGELLKGKNKTANNTELAIYVIPRIEQAPQNELDLGDELQQLYDQFTNASTVKTFVPGAGGY